MTQPLHGVRTTGDPIDRWGLIFHGSGPNRVAHTRQDWACIADAIATADRRQDEAAAAVLGTPPFDRGDATWCTHAADTYQMLTTAGAHWYLRPGDDLFCAADEHFIRAYFAAPWVPPTTPPQTMLDTSGWDISFDPARPVDPTAPVMLVNVAQDLGLLGGPGHRVGLWRATDHTGEFTDGFVVTVGPYDEPGWASHPMPARALVPAGAAPVDAIVGVLTRVAAVANTLLATHQAATAPATTAAHRQRGTPPVPAHVDGHAVGDRSRAFPPIASATLSTPDSPTAVPANAAPRRHR